MTDRPLADNEEEILHNAIAHYGSQHQLLKLIEELGELSREVTKVLLDEADFEHLAEEAADVLILLNQLQEMFPVVADKWPEYYYAKLGRLRKRMEEEKADG